MLRITAALLFALLAVAAVSVISQAAPIGVLRAGAHGHSRLVPGRLVPVRYRDRGHNHEQDRGCCR